MVGETDMIPKEGEWSAANQHPITLLNTSYKWLTGILKDKMESHLVRVVQSPISANPGLTLNNTYEVNPGLALIEL